MVKKILVGIRDFMSYAALGFLGVMASQQFISPFYLNLTPRPWFGLVIFASAVAVALRLRTTRKQSATPSAQVLQQ
jgi:hypothetical protein